MVLRLVVDVVWRTRFGIALAVLQLYICCKMILDIFPATDTMAPLLMGAFFLTIPAGEMFKSLVLNPLPVSRRTWWLARWWLAAASAVVVPVLATSLAQWSARPAPPTVEEIALCVIFAFLYGGSAMAVIRTRWGRAGDKPINFQPGRIFKALLRVLAGGLAVLPIPLAAPYFFARYLPHTFSEFDGRSAVVMLVMAAVSAWGYMYQPAVEARPSLRGPSLLDMARVDRAPKGEVYRASTTRARFSDRLTGLRLPLWEMSRKYFISYALVIGGGIVWWWITSFSRAVPPLAVVLSKADMLPFSSDSAHVTEAITLGSLFLITSFLDVWIVSNFRPLRALPLTSNQLSCIPIHIGLVSSATLWAVFLALHMVVLRTQPVSFRLDLFVAYAALSAVSQTLRMTIPGHVVVKGTVSLVPLLLTWLVVGYFDTFRADIVQPAMLFGGLAALGASFAVMRYAITRSSGLYRPQFQHVRFGS